MLFLVFFRLGNGVAGPLLLTSCGQTATALALDETALAKAGVLKAGMGAEVTVIQVRENSLIKTEFFGNQAPPDGRSESGPLVLRVNYGKSSALHPGRNPVVKWFKYQTWFGPKTALAKA